FDENTVFEVVRAHLIFKVSRKYGKNKENAKSVEKVVNAIREAKTCNELRHIDLSFLPEDKQQIGKYLLKKVERVFRAIEALRSNSKDEMTILKDEIQKIRKNREIELQRQEHKILGQCLNFLENPEKNHSTFLLFIAS